MLHQDIEKMGLQVGKMDQDERLADNGENFTGRAGM
jgi:hypothetical protein